MIKTNVKVHEQMPLIGAPVLMNSYYKFFKWGWMPAKIGYVVAVQPVSNIFGEPTDYMLIISWNEKTRSAHSISSKLIIFDLTTEYVHKTRPVGYEVGGIPV